jgi:hypothetical protein
LIDLFLQIREDIRIDVNRGLWFSHSGVHYTLKWTKETRDALGLRKWLRFNVIYFARWLHHVKGLGETTGPITSVEATDYFPSPRA